MDTEKEDDQEVARVVFRYGLFAQRGGKPSNIVPRPSYHEVCLCIYV
jgi:hypothetical protein